MIHTIVVCGAGTMGSGIAQLALQHGFHTVLFDREAGLLDKARVRIGAGLARASSKTGLDPADIPGIMDGLHTTTDIHDAIGDIIIEAVTERMDVKTALLGQLAEINHSDTILATNTSSLSVTTLAEGLPHPGRVCGMHFFNPAPVMRLVEVVRTPHTRDEVAEAVISLAHALGREPVTCLDSPGFIVNRVARPYYLGALRLVEEDSMQPSTIDDLMESIGFRMGPFRLMDLIGNDVNLAVSRSLWEACGRPERLRPSALQEARVSEGALGRKTGRGFYTYSEETLSGPPVA
jgi:3-hydroxybutyryl-CoA dehydrogenase